MHHVDIDDFVAAEVSAYLADSCRFSDVKEWRSSAEKARFG